MSLDHPGWRRDEWEGNRRIFRCRGFACSWAARGTESERPTFCPTCGSVYIDTDFDYEANDWGDPIEPEPEIGARMPGMERP